MNEYRFEDIKIGMSESFEVTVTQEMMDGFRAITGDYNPLHCDEVFARAQGQDGCVVYGMLTASFFSTLAGIYLPGRYSLIRSVESKFPRPVVVGEKLMVTGTVTEINSDFRFFEMKTEIRDSRGDKVCRGKMQVGVTA